VNVSYLDFGLKPVVIGCLSKDIAPLQIAQEQACLTFSVLRATSS